MTSMGTEELGGTEFFLSYNSNFTNDFLKTKNKYSSLSFSLNDYPEILKQNSKRALEISQKLSLHWQILCKEKKINLGNWC